MRAIEAAGFGIENLRLVEKDVPNPQYGEVLIRLHAAALNYRDILNIASSSTGFSATSASARGAYVPASDGAGIVEAVGPGVTQFKPGDRVTTMFYQVWTGGRMGSDVKILGGTGPGTLQDYVCLSQDGVARTPDFLTDAEAATLTCAGLTAWNAVVDVQPGETVLIQGTGGVSIFALQFAKMRGATVVLTSSSDEKLERGRALGADHLINYKAVPDWAAAARTATGGRGVDHVVEIGGADTIAQSLESVGVGGKVAIVGVLGGVPSQAPILQLVMKKARMVGIGVGSRDDFEAMARAIIVAGIRPVISQTYKLADARDAFTAVQKGQHFGKVAIDIAG